MKTKVLSLPLVGALLAALVVADAHARGLGEETFRRQLATSKTMSPPPHPPPSPSLTPPGPSVKNCAADGQNPWVNASLVPNFQQARMSPSSRTKPVPNYHLPLAGLITLAKHCSLILRFVLVALTGP
jgi:hypothetical protein